MTWRGPTGFSPASPGRGRADRLRARCRASASAHRGGSPARAPVDRPDRIIAQVWRDGARQARLAALVHDDRVEVVPLDLEQAKAVGALCARAAASDVVDGHVALLAGRFRGIVVTSDPRTSDGSASRS